MQKSIQQLYQEHQGKVTDKWTIYLPEYERCFSFLQNCSVRLLEIGIQNGGSLEIWSGYFPQAEKIVGCDINPHCQGLTYDDPRIAVVVGDANQDETEKTILGHSPHYDLIIDDGSHRSSDIVKTFVRYFPHLVDGGLFILEDLHCSYWQKFEGGLFDPYSSINFFKRLVDIINREHWGLDKPYEDLLGGFARQYDVLFNEEVLAQVHSVEFINSMCVIRKSAKEQNQLGARIISGKYALIDQFTTKYENSKIDEIIPNQSKNFWSIRSMPPDEELVYRLEELAHLKQDAANRDAQITLLTKSVIERDAQISFLTNFRDEVLNSKSWRITRPMRDVIRYLRRFGGDADLANEPMAEFVSESAIPFDEKPRRSERKGMPIACESAREILTVNQIRGGNAEGHIFLKMVSRQSCNLLEQRILIIAELSIPQCSKYRVEQKQEIFKHLGINCTVHSWVDTVACLNALQTHSIVIFYRVPAFQDVLEIINEANRLKILTIWEVDDLIFDRDILAGSKSLAGLEPDIFQGLLEGAVLYRTAMLLCKKGIASTTGLASAMQQAGVSEVFVIENALDRQTLIQVEKIKEARSKRTDNVVRIVYGSGTSTHSVDFREAAAAILHILSTCPAVRFCLIGTLELPEEFAQYQSQIERISLCKFDEYLCYLADCDISIAPLEDNIFNDAKSNIKFLEASVLQIPSVCSPRASFCRAITSGRNGFLCTTPDEWIAALTLLVSDTKKRENIGKAAYESVITAYNIENIGKSQVLPILMDHQRQANKMRVLSVNIYYSPYSFGGATVVAEGVNKIINEGSDFEIFVFTTLPIDIVPAYSTRRYEVDGVCVYGVGLPSIDDTRTEFENCHILDAFENVLLAVKPDLVHFHSIQGIGVAVTDLCVAMGVRYIVTLHDAWWLCGRQFMIDQHGKYCFQEEIDMKLCRKCVDDVDLYSYRQTRLIAVLKNATVLLSPSQFFSDFYTKNGFSVEKVLINTNGIQKPADGRRYRHKGPLTFAYVGGNTEVKGVSLVRKVFTEISEMPIKLVVVDNYLNLGYSSYHDFSIELGDVEIVPAYTKSTIDDFFSHIDVLLFPTQCKESFGLTIREALARNVWVITTDAGGVVEPVLPGKNGFIIPINDNGEALKQAVLDTIQYFQRFQVNDEVHLEVKKINWFEDQAKELALIYQDIINDNSLTI